MRGDVPSHPASRRRPDGVPGKRFGGQRARAVTATVTRGCAGRCRQVARTTKGSAPDGAGKRPRRPLLGCRRQTSSALAGLWSRSVDEGRLFARRDADEDDRACNHSDRSRIAKHHQVDDSQQSEEEPHQTRKLPRPSHALIVARSAKACGGAGPNAPQPGSTNCPLARATITSKSHRSAAPNDNAAGPTGPRYRRIFGGDSTCFAGPPECRAIGT